MKATPNTIPPLIAEYLSFLMKIEFEMQNYKK